MTVRALVGGALNWEVANCRTVLTIGRVPKNSKRRVRRERGLESRYVGKETSIDKCSEVEIAAANEDGDCILNVVDDLLNVGVEYEDS